jgi:hypothetical protein
MKALTIRRIGLLLGAVLAIALSASPALAVDWGPDVKLSSTLTSDHELVRTGPNSAMAVWHRGPTVIARRTFDGGRTWLPSQTLATGVGLGLGVASVGQKVDLVYPVRVTCPATRDWAYRLYYRRSSNGGGSWSTPRALTSTCSRISEPDVARSADGQVSIVWTGMMTGRILMLTSRDGGITFRAAVHVATTTIRDIDVTPGSGGSSCCHVAKPAVAIGANGTTYAAYASASRTLSIRRSLDRGATWSTPIRLTAWHVTSRASLVASGARAIVGYTDRGSGKMAAVYRTTADRGSTWSSQRFVVSQTGSQFSAEPEFAIDGSVLGVIVKFGPPGRSPVWYRESTNWGTTWSATIRVSPAPRSGLDPETAGLALLAGHALAGHAENGGTEGFWIRQGTR